MITGSCPWTWLHQGCMKRFLLMQRSCNSSLSPCKLSLFPASFRWFLSTTNTGATAGKVQYMGLSSKHYEIIPSYEGTVSPRLIWNINGSQLHSLSPVTEHAQCGKCSRKSSKVCTWGRSIAQCYLNFFYIILSHYFIRLILRIVSPCNFKGPKNFPYSLNE